MFSLFSDLHANRVALERVLPKMLRSEAILFLGDAVGYRKSPEKALRLLRDNVDLALLGNHDAAATGQFPEFMQLLPPWLENTLLEVENVDVDLFEWLATRPLRASWGDIEMVHGTFRDPLMEFLTPGKVAGNHLAMQRGQISFVGHTHKPLAIGIRDGQQEVFLPSQTLNSLDLSRAERWVINPGSLGAKDIASWVTFDERQESVVWHFL